MKNLMGLMLRCIALFLAALGGVAQSQPSIAAEPVTSVDYDAKRARIEQARGLAQASYEEAAMLCYQRFAVNDCLRDARELRRDLLADLRQQSLALRDAQARQKASQR